MQSYGGCENGGRHGRLSLLGLREVAVLFLCELEAAGALELSSVWGGYVLVTFQEERKLRDALVSLSTDCVTRLVTKNSQNRSVRKQSRSHTPQQLGIDPFLQVRI